jgi:hypothetical protein
MGLKPIAIIKIKNVILRDSEGSYKTDRLRTSPQDWQAYKIFRYRSR